MTDSEHRRSLFRRLLSRTLGYGRHLVKRLPERRARREALSAFRQAAETPGTEGTVPTLLAFYLPQFHPIPENDEWWGPGFSEWTNVASARPQFRGHVQPSLPADLGFYDLRLSETRRDQAELARQYGIGGFCYWHYWFNGRRLLERPFDEVLASGEPNFPFCLSWANESWTRTWLGAGEVLMEQTYSAADDKAHASWLAQTFADHRYIRIDGRPLFLLYRPTAHPELGRFASELRTASLRSGAGDPLILGMNGWSPYTDATELGLDGTVDFQPQFGDLSGVRHSGLSLSKVLRNIRTGRPTAAVTVWDYREAHREMLGRRAALGFRTVPTVLVGWDNTPRRGSRAVVLTDNDAGYFGRAVAAEMHAVASDPGALPLVFINAWNEWAEGNHLEPGVPKGRAHLQALKDARRVVSSSLGKAAPMGSSEPASPIAAGGRADEGPLHTR